LLGDTRGVVTEACHLDGDVVLAGDLVDGGSSARCAEKQWAREKKRASEGSSLLLLVRLAGSEGHPVEFADFSEVVLQHDVGQFVRDIAVLSPWCPERTYDNDPAIIDLEGGSGEGEGLKSL